MNQQVESSQLKVEPAEELEVFRAVFRETPALQTIWRAKLLEMRYIGAMGRIKELEANGSGPAPLTELVPVQEDEDAS